MYIEFIDLLFLLVTWWEIHILFKSYTLSRWQTLKLSKPSNSEDDRYFIAIKFFLRENDYATQLDTTPSRNSSDSTMKRQSGLEPLYQTRPFVRTYRIQRDWILILSRLRRGRVLLRIRNNSFARHCIVHFSSQSWNH